MFTGLIETMGTISGLNRTGKSVELCIRPDTTEYRVEIGGSVAIDGTCLTLTRKSGVDLYFTAVLETLRRTTLAEPFIGRRINMERALRVDGRLDGHMVLGHVDGTGMILSDRSEGVSLVRTIKIPAGLELFMATKGSVAVDGISLTISASGQGTISLSLIPHTIANTTMSIKKTGDSVNLECDVLARYLHQMMKTEKVSPAHGDRSGQGSLLDMMERFGF